MFRSVLIANRGEIALRVARTARRMGLRVIAVHSDADAKAPFVAFADEAYRIGPAPARESYLVAARILEVAKKAGRSASIPATASSRRMPNSPRLALRLASRSWARRLPPSAPWA